MLRVIHYPHPTLAHLSRPLRRVDAELTRMLAEMFELMYEHKGVGLAANQVDLPYRMFVMNVSGDPGKKDQEFVFLNPVLAKQQGLAESEEGCLSLPGVYAPVKRPEKVEITGYNLAGQQVTLALSGLPARVVQHEVDHLDGTMFIDRLTATHKLALKSALDEFATEFQQRRATGEIPSDETIAARWAELERLRT